MKSQVSDHGKNEKLIEVDLTENELKPYFDTTFRKYQKNIRLQGFRKGKVPLSLIKKMYGEEIKKEAIEEVVQSVFKEISHKEKLRPVAPAKLKEVNYEPNQGLNFKALIEVVPEVQLKHYKGLSVEREIYQVDDEDVAAALEDLRERMAVMQPVEDVAEENHFVLADLQEVDVTGVPILGQKFENQFFQLSMSNTNKDLAEQLIGVKAGETRRVTLSSLKGGDNKEQKNEIYDISVKEIKSKQLPDLDDDLAKDDGKFETLEELKSDIKRKLIQQTHLNAKRMLNQRIIDELLKTNSFDLPSSMIDNYLDALVENAKKNGNQKFDEEAIREEYRPAAIWNLKWEIVKDKIVETENITVTETDKEAYLIRTAKDRGMDEKKLRSSLNTKKAQQRFEEDVLESKVLDYLKNNAKINDKKITKKEIEKSKQISISP